MFVSDIFFLSLSVMGIIMSFYCSVVYHTFNTGSFEMSCFLSRLDYFGIILHLIGCMLALVYFAYYDRIVLQVLYLMLFTTILVISMIMNYHSMFSSVAKNMSSLKRTLFFFFVAFLSLPPQIECLLNSSQVMLHICVTDLAYVMSAFAYTLKYPERLFPGRFDLFNSHAIFHILIVISGFGSIKTISLIAFDKINMRY